MSTLDEIAAERRRQIDEEGWTAEHDDYHTEGELARAGACYAINAAARSMDHSAVSLHVMAVWPWSLLWWKPKTPRRDLIRAAALLVAEIERLDRDSCGASAPPRENAHG